LPEFRSVDLRNMFYMRLRILFFSGLIFIPAFFCFAQENIDSLKLVLSTCETDTNKVNLFNRLSWDLRSIDPTEAMKDAELGKSLSLQLDFEKGTATSYNNIGVIHYRRGEYVEAIESHLQALSIREKIGDKKGMALSYINLGNVYSEQKNNALALEQYQHAEKILNETGDVKRLLFVYLNISAIDLMENNFDAGLIYAEKAKDAAKKQNDKTVEAEALNNIGVVKENQLRYEEALAAYMQAFSISKSIDDKTSLVDNMINIGDIYRLQKKFDQALEWHNKTEKIAREIGYLEGLRVLYENLSKDYQAMGNFEIALNYHIRFKDLNDSLFNADNISRINSITSRWDDDRKEKEFIQLQRDLMEREWVEKQSGQRRWFISGGIIALLIFCGSVLHLNRKMRILKSRRRRNSNY
jgi:tetratricopeptide (TPR) repeat protein